MNKKTNKTGTTPRGITPRSGDENSGYILKVFGSLRNPVFRFYYLSMLGQWSSEQMLLVARSLLVYRISGSGAILGLSALATAVPMVIFSFPGGAIADRMSKKHILLFSQVGLVLVSLGIAGALSIGYISTARAGSWWLLIFAGVIQGIISGLMSPARQAIISETVDSKQVVNAVSLNHLGTNTIRLVSPVVAGFIIDAFDFDVAYYVITGTYVIATIFMLLMPRATSREVRGSSAILDIKEGMQYVRYDKLILLILLSIFLGTVVWMPFNQLLPMFTEDILKVGASGLGLLVSISSIASIISSLVLASQPNRKRGTIMLGAGIVLGLGMLAFSFSEKWLASVVFAAFIGIGQTAHSTMSISLIQNYAPPDYTGRVMSFVMAAAAFSSVIVFFLGLLAEVVGAPWAVGGLAIIFVLITIVMWFFSPRLRKLD